ncbi:50S ribosomal protein L24 [Candidatus Micrarchaeota archaeon]|nr:50S ribosomal protein L24 [Candidatus Micrarchaeota archaeon]
MVSPTDSKQPRKQRKARYEAPLHIRQKWLAVHMDKEMKGKLKTARRSVPVREGDRVKIMRGENSGKSGKVSRVDLRYGKVYVEGVVRKKGKGGEALIPIDPSKLLMIEAGFSDKMRGRILERSRKIE